MATLTKAAMAAIDAEIAELGEPPRLAPYRHLYGDGAVSTLGTRELAFAEDQVRRRNLMDPVFVAGQTTPEEQARLDEAEAAVRALEPLVASAEAAYWKITHPAKDRGRMGTDEVAVAFDDHQQSKAVIETERVMAGLRLDLQTAQVERGLVVRLVDAARKARVRDAQAKVGR